MKLSLSWLKNYIDPKLSTDNLIQRLVMAGWEVEAVETVGKDTVFELEITPNRPDCLNVLGLAREIGAITAKKVNYPKIKSYKAGAVKIPLTIEDKKDCSRYVATLIKEVTIADAPKNIKDCLISLGMNPISNAVDITNFVLMEIGQPLHVFDYDKIAGGKIVVRRAKQGEKIVTIDGIERSLDPSILVIADAKKPVAIAGLMGGKDTEVSLSTTNILLESAHFDMTLVRRASRKLGLRSDSSYRFERNVDWQGVLTGANRATDLLLELTKGKLAARSEIAHLTKLSSQAIKLTQEDVEQVLGLKVPVATIKRILTGLDFKVLVNGNSLTVTAPDFRGDIKQGVDLVEEIARTIGFDHMPTSLPQIKAKNLTIDPRPAQVKKITRNTLMACGLDEIVTLSMISSKDLAKCQQQDLKQLRVFNPLSSEQELMRPSLLPSFMKVAAGNFNRGQKNLRLFEIAKCYPPQGEKTTLSLLLTGNRHHDWRLSRREQVEFSDIKGALTHCLNALGVKAKFESTKEPFLDDACASSVSINNQVVGTIGKLSKAVLSQWDIKHQDIYFASIDLETLMNTPRKAIRFEPLAEFPAMTRDVSLAISKDVRYGSIEELCYKNGGEILHSVQFIEQYVGDKVASDQKALVFSLAYQNRTRTLREEEVNTTHEQIVNSLINKFGAKRR